MTQQLVDTAAGDAECARGRRTARGRGAGRLCVAAALVAGAIGA